MEDDIYNLTVKGNDLKTYIRRFQELAVLCPTMVPNSKKLMEVFIGGLSQIIEGNITASKPQTLEEAITITQSVRLASRWGHQTGTAINKGTIHRKHLQSISDLVMPVGSKGITKSVPKLKQCPWKSIHWDEVTRTCTRPPNK
ncbi:hypothetical protein Tco_0853745 [Tanacetum coccineum]